MFHSRYWIWFLGVLPAELWVNRRRKKTYRIHLDHHLDSIKDSFYRFIDHLDSSQLQNGESCISLKWREWRESGCWAFMILIFHICSNKSNKMITSNPQDNCMIISQLVHQNTARYTNSITIIWVIFCTWKSLFSYYNLAMGNNFPLPQSIASILQISFLLLKRLKWLFILH